MSQQQFNAEKAVDEFRRGLQELINGHLEKGTPLSPMNSAFADAEFELRTLREKVRMEQRTLALSRQIVTAGVMPPLPPGPTSVR